MPTKPEFIEVNRQDRIYEFPGGCKVEIKDVISINVSKSGTHRINTLDGLKHLVAPGWLHLICNIDGDWTF